MESILDQFNQARQQEDLFLFWQDEFELRRLCRVSTSPELPLHITDDEEINFLFRSLYFSGHKNQFFSLLFDNLQQMPVLNWFNWVPDWLRDSFLAFLPWHIDNTKAQPAELMGLIRIYHDDHRQSFLPIVNLFNLETCNYLLPRTANPGFRKMIQIRQKSLLTARSEYSYGILNDNSRGLPYPTIFGDKLVVLRQAVDLLQRSNPGYFREPYGSERFQFLLQCAELMFRSGLIEDCLAFLLDSYEDYREKNRLIDVMEDMAIHKQFKKILRSLIPMYAIMKQPVQALHLAGEIYRRDFSQISPDEYSLYYLDLFASIYSGLYRQQPEIVYELVLKSGAINLYCSGEPEMLTSLEAQQGLSTERLGQLQQAYRQKMVGRPHEALVTMEMVRLLAQLGLNQLNHTQANHLLHSYLALWKWVPSHCFLNESIIEQLFPLADRHHRQEIERIQPWLNDHNGDKIKAELAAKPDLFRKKGEEIRRIILLSHFTGVMQ